MLACFAVTASQSWLVTAYGGLASYGLQGLARLQEKRLENGAAAAAGGDVAAFFVFDLAFDKTDA